MKVTVILGVIFVIPFIEASPVTRETFVFIDDDKTAEKDPIITPPVLPVIEHLERDPSTLRKEDNEISPRTRSGPDNVSPRFGFTGGFGIVPSKNGGFSASVSHGFSGAGGHSQSASHTLNVGGLSNGQFQASQASSQSSSFGGNNGFLGPSLSGSQASSQSSSFSAGLNGFQSSSSGSSAGSMSGNILGNGFSSSHAQSSANSFGINAPFGQPDASGSDSDETFGGFNGAGAQSSGFGFGQNGNGFSGSGSASQSGAAVIQNRLPIPKQPPQRPISSLFEPNANNGRGFGTPIVFPGPTNNKFRNPNLRPLHSGLIPPRQSKQQQFRPIRRKPSMYKIIRIEV